MMKHKIANSRNKNVKLIGYYKVPNDDKICKILYLNIRGSEYFWLYRGVCLCHTRHHEGSKNPNFPHFAERNIYNLDGAFIGEVISEIESSLTPIEITFNGKLYKLFLSKNNKGTQTTFELCY